MRKRVLWIGMLASFVHQLSYALHGALCVMVNVVVYIDAVVEQDGTTGGYDRSNLITKSAVNVS